MIFAIAITIISMFTASAAQVDKKDDSLTGELSQSLLGQNS